ncbi:hypothetical protein BKA70DRAFT_1405051 [Coprinopsis sp. MPI-PUGE-AT-0042]|nr:hypothetical protein BKA70DRAFT_1405051 [Coprinopsis sp. MPI-PUGE-AT-0042]
MSAATSNLVRRVFVDDADKGFTFRGPWTILEDDFADYPNFGPVYRGSQHRLLGDTGSVRFEFKGSGSVAIFGTSMPLNNSGVYDPSYTCELDDVKVPSQEPLTNLPINLWALCFTNSTYEGDHVLTVSAVSTERAFFVDRINYVPSRESPPKSPTVAIDPDDVAVEYLEGSWKTDKVAGMLTQQAGAKMSITFTGSSARFMGSVPLDFPTGNSTATYSIDGRPPVTFVVPGLGRNPLLPMFGQPLFEVKNLDSGVHELIVTYNGQAAPLVFEHLQVEDGDIIQTALTRDVGGDTPPAGGNSSGGKKTPIGAIVGGAVGGAVLLLALLALVLFMKKRKERQRAQAAAAAAAVFVPPHSPTEPKSPVSSTYEVKPLRFSNQSPPTTFQTMSNTATGDSSPQGPTLGYFGHHPTASYSAASGLPFNPHVHNSAPQYVGQPAQARMSVSYPQNNQVYSRAPEPMA